MTDTQAPENQSADDPLKADVAILLNAMTAIERLSHTMLVRGHIGEATALLKARKSITDALKSMT